MNVALPILNESENLPTLIDCLRNQEIQDFRLVVCVNNYEHWWDDAEKIESCEDNLKSIEYLKCINDLDIEIIDKSSRGSGWPIKKGGVGWARKTLMDHIADNAKSNDLIVSVDADSYYPENYLSAINDRFDKAERLHGLALPYYHKLAGDETDRLILHYEIYMRYYLLNMLRIRSPFSFTALGSAMAVPVWAYKKVGGLTPVKSGEDFYFLQKLVKTGKIGLWCDTIAYPSSRFSDRVLFGTGPALIKGRSGNWDSYPIYNYESFKKVKETFSLFHRLFDEDIVSPMDAFLKNQFRTDDLWGAIRNNYKDKSNFIKACINKVDGLRILQYLRVEHQKSGKSDKENLVDYFEKFWNVNDSVFDSRLNDLDFESSPIKLLDELRNYLFERELEARKEFDLDE